MHIIRQNEHMRGHNSSSRFGDVSALELRVKMRETNFNTHEIKLGISHSMYEYCQRKLWLLYHMTGGTQAQALTK